MKSSIYIPFSFFLGSKSLFLIHYSIFLIFSISLAHAESRVTLLDGGHAVRVQIAPEGYQYPEELVLVDPDAPASSSLRVSSPWLSASLDAETQIFTLKDHAGNELLRTQPLTAMGEASFSSPRGEYLYGTGQFQDGYLNARGLSRRLTQVNTQIAIPMVLSNRGYALMWHNYGLTDFNPSEAQLTMTEQNQSQGQGQVVNVTSTTGNRQERRREATFEATLEVGNEGDYSLLIDCGQKMARHHYVVIDGQVVVDHNNIWLPPTMSFIVHLTQGKHRVEYRGDTRDKPTVGWRKVSDWTTFRSPGAGYIDFIVMVGSGDEAIASYRRLTGGTPEMPSWALGYIHCRERYDSQQELLANATEFRRRDIPISMIVQDWQYWGRYGWNAMRFDEQRYPDPRAMVDSLHRMNIRFMLSVWSKIDRNADLGREAAERGYYIDGTEWIDFFNPTASAFYWQNYKERLLPIGIDAWWQDATEPENDDLTGRLVNAGKAKGDDYRCIYPLLVNRTVWEGLEQEKRQNGRESFILTRSAFLGQQRYGTATWSGDVGNDWETLRRQIVGGLGMMASGQPWWTYDAGGFFRPSDQYTNADYQERMLRWIETSVFLPMMRVHGYMSQTEPWRYQPETERIFVENIRLRHRLLPYIEAQAKRVATEGYTLMRPLVMDFPDDEKALQQETEFMFGPSFLVCPITQPRVTSWRVYLPKGERWKDYFSERIYEGGQSVDVPVTLDHIPVFFRVSQPEK